MDGARPATSADLGDLERLARLALDEMGPRRGGDLWRRQVARREPVAEGLAADLAAPADRACCVVGTVDGAVVGYGVSRTEELADGAVLAVVTDLFVEPGARGVGVGEAMMGLLVDHARQVGAVGIDSLALPGDRDTKNFFESAGLKARAIVVHRSLSADGGSAAGDGA